MQVGEHEFTITGLPMSMDPESFRVKGLIILIGCTYILQHTVGLSDGVQILEIGHVVSHQYLSDSPLSDLADSPGTDTASKVVSGIHDLVILCS